MLTKGHNQDLSREVVNTTLRENSERKSGNNAESYEAREKQLKLEEKQKGRTGRGGTSIGNPKTVASEDKNSGCCCFLAHKASRALFSLRPAERLLVPGLPSLPCGSFHKSSVAEAARLCVIRHLKGTPVCEPCSGLELRLHCDLRIGRVCRGEPWARCPLSSNLHG